MGYQIGQTAVIVPVLAAEPAVAEWRAEYDRSAAFGVPAHLTIVFPFVPLDALHRTDVAALVRLFAGVPAFELTLPRVEVFPARAGDQPVAYLAPDPDEPFRRLTSALVTRWPQAPPYGGAFDDVVPHLTVTETAPPPVIEAVASDLAPRLPIVTTIDRGSLIGFDGARWREHAPLLLG